MPAARVDVRPRLARGAGQPRGDARPARRARRAARARSAPAAASATSSATASAASCSRASASSCCSTATRRSSSCSRSWPGTPTSTSARRNVVRHRRRRGRRVRDQRHRPDGPRRHEQPVHARARRCARRRSRSSTGCRWSTSSSPAAPTCPTQAEAFIPGGAIFRNLTRLSRARHPDDRARVRQLDRRRRLRARACRDYTVFVEGRAKVFLGGPPLVKMATGEESDDEELGGAEMHARVAA